MLRALNRGAAPPGLRTGQEWACAGLPAGALGARPQGPPPLLLGLLSLSQGKEH